MRGARHVTGGMGVVKAPPTKLGGWRGRAAHPLIRDILADTRFALLPEVDSPVGWTAFWWANPVATPGLPLVCKVCGDRPPRATLNNLLNQPRCGYVCSCTVRPRWTTDAGRAELVGICERSGVDLVVPADEWEARHRKRDTRPTVIEAVCRTCNQTVSVPAHRALKRHLFHVNGCRCVAAARMATLLAQDASTLGTPRKRGRRAKPASAPTDPRGSATLMRFFAKRPRDAPSESAGAEAVDDPDAPARAARQDVLDAASGSDG